jgi:hypothetical protein
VTISTRPFAAEGGWADIAGVVPTRRTIVLQAPFSLAQGAR